MTKIRSYSELKLLPSFEERYRYLRLQGQVGTVTFGFDRWVNQRFYTSAQWRTARRAVILRDQGCDLGVEGYELSSDALIHHMNPVTREDLFSGAEWILEPEFLIVTSKRTHNAIHFGDERSLPTLRTERTPGDTTPWR